MSASRVVANRQRFLTELEASFSSLLASCGFGPEPRWQKTAQRDFLTWVRESEWKQDAVKIDHRPGGEAIGLGVEVHLPLSADETVFFDGLGVDHLLGRRGYRIPTGAGTFARWRARALVNRMAKDCLAALSWFDQSASPAAALARLRTGETNGCGSGGRAYTRVERYLEGLTDGPVGASSTVSTGGGAGE